MRDDLPEGNVTLLLTDIEGSTRLLHGLGESYAEVLGTHREILRRAFRTNGGVEVDTQGDAFFIAFPSATGCVRAAVQAQRELARHSWPSGNEVRVRMGAHLGEPTRTDEGFVGIDVHVAARICSAGHGGQILLSAHIAEALMQELEQEGLTLRDLGEHRLKDLSGPWKLYQVVIPELPSDFAPLRTLDTRPNNLPTPPTPFIGRAREVARIRDLMLRSDVRLVTLTGPGGTGKSRLGLRVATELLHSLRDGAFYVPLAAVSDPALVVSTIAQTFGVRESPGLPPLQALIDELRDQELLLLLDNFEQVLPAARQLAELMAQCPHLKVLVTSREILRLSAERDVPIPPLGLPERDPLPPLAELGEYEAIRLFAERAQASSPDFELSDHNAQLVAEICLRLDGLPLAIELAAARVRNMAPSGLLTQLEHRLTVLTEGPVDLPERQQTLRDAIAWSYDLLGPDEQKLCRRLAVFVGGCTPDAAAAVCDAQADFEADFEKIATSLVDKSLLRREGGRGTGPAQVLALAEQEQVRLSMLETIREYALEQLTASGEEPPVRRFHQTWCVDLCEELEPRIRTQDVKECLDLLEREHGNLRSALGWSLADGGDGAAAALRLGASLWLFWYQHGHLSEGRRWLEDALSAGREASLSLRARALLGAAELARHQHEMERAIELAEEGLAIYRELGEKSGIARALGQLGVMAQFQEKLDRAWDLLEESLKLSREVGDSERTGYALASLGTTAHLREDYDLAKQLYEESLRFSRERGEKGSIATLLMNLGEVAELQGDPSRAASLYRESLSLYHELQIKPAIAYCLENLAELAAKQAHFEHSAQLFAAAEALREAVGAPMESYSRERREQAVATVRGGLASETFDRAWRAGRALRLDAAIACALEEEVIGPGDT